MAANETTPSFPYSKTIPVPDEMSGALYMEFVDELSPFKVALVHYVDGTPYFRIAGEKDYVDIYYMVIRAWLKGVSLVPVKENLIDEVAQHFPFLYHIEDDVSRTSYKANKS